MDSRELIRRREDLGRFRISERCEPLRNDEIRQAVKGEDAKRRKRGAQPFQDAAATRIPGPGRPQDEHRSLRIGAVLEQSDEPRLERGALPRPRRPRHEQRPARVGDDLALFGIRVECPHAADARPRY